jgi:dihydroorotate dehydrogenase electron transfer subunit
LPKESVSDIFAGDRIPMFKDPCALIVRKEAWGDYCLLVLHSPRIAREARPGQFLMVKVSDQPYPLLRRPFSLHARDKSRVELFFSKAGIGTAMLAEKKPGETLDILGPLGKGFRLGKRPAGGKTVFLVGGGRGIAPLYFSARILRSRGDRPLIFYGGRTESHLPLLPKLVQQRFETFVSTDDGSLGFHGFVCPMFERELARWRCAPRRGRARRRVEVFACGPDPMLKRVAEIAAAYRVPAQFSLESIMGCGIGACWGCVKKIKTGGQTEWVKVCEEGPVFRDSEIVWGS